MDSNRVAVDRYKRMIAIMVVMTWSGVVAASELIDFEEQTKINNINAAYEDQYKAAGVDESISKYNKLNSDIELAKTKIANNIEMIKSDTVQLQNGLMDGNYDESLMLTLRSSSANISTLRHQLSSFEKSLAETEQNLSQGQQLVGRLARTKNEELLSLYEKIKARHINESRHVIDDTYTGKLSCNVADSMSSCVNRNLPSMKNAFTLSKGGLSRIKLVNFKVVDATQKLNGDVTYNVDASYKRLYSKNIEVELRKALGLEKVRFVLRSNSKQTEFYINGQNVGSGELVDIDGDYSGIYNIKATNKGQVQSLRIHVENGGDYFFPFSKEASNLSPKEVAKSKTPATNNQVARQAQAVITSAQQKSLVGSDSLYTNTVVYKDQAFTYLYPVYRGNKTAQKVFLTRNEATEYCESKLSSKLPSKAAYQYLELYADLAKGDYWTAEGKVYSSQKHEEFDKTFDRNQFVCMVSMLN